MLDILQGAILGVIQGLGEFLPISSSGHLVLLPAIADWEYQGLDFDVALHLGTLIAVLIYFRKDIVQLLKALVSSVKDESLEGDPNRKLVWFLGLGTIPAVTFGLLFKDQIETVVRSPIVVALALILMGGLLWYADWSGKKNRKLTKITWKHTVLIGCFQALALIPGVSRSGATITAGLLLGYNRKESAKFSFLLAIPVIVGATMLSVVDFVQNGGITVGMVVGTVVSAIVGYFAIWFLMKLVQTRGYFGFVVYRFLLGIGILIWWFI